ncbi:MAG: cupin domain-containing protein [Methylocystaceae bacterium]|nr:cupin domain-containing protein [Methylocystaceae bacterium]
MDKFNVGDRLKQVRKEYKLSQRELARRAGITNGTISLIEKNQNSPSIAMLRKILEGIPMDLSAFFSAGEHAKDKVFFKPNELTELSNDNLLSFLQVGDAKHHNLQILKETYHPGGDTGKTMLRHLSTEGGIVTKGCIELTVGDSTQVLKVGDCYLFDSTTPHRFRNTSDEICEIISACSPPYV